MCQYYFDVHNVSESRIKFRHATIPDPKSQAEYTQIYPFPDLTYYAELWGYPVEGLLGYNFSIQEIGSVKTPHGRLLVFPNILEHKVELLRLMDSTKPGHSRMLVLWLVDPDYRIMSTQNVPPQQPEWQSGAAIAILRRKRGRRWPEEVLTIIAEKLDQMSSFPLDLAKEYRSRMNRGQDVPKRGF